MMEFICWSQLFYIPALWFIVGFMISDKWYGVKEEELR